MKPPFKILYEDDFLLAVEKPSGLVSVPSPNTPESKTLQGYMRAWALPEKKFKPYLLNRLDLQTSGIVLMGKFPRDREKLEAIFQHPATKKTYLALVKGVPKRRNGAVRFPLEARHRDIKVPAITHYQTLKSFDQISLLEVTLETGRKHQVRKHLAMIGNPLVMDREYGDINFNRKFQNKFHLHHFVLHAWKIEFLHPFLEKLTTIESPAKAIDSIIKRM